MISFSDISKLFSRCLYGRSCLEIEFLLNGYPQYQSCWMGKMPDESEKEKELYWYGLVPDGSQAYHYYNFEEFSSAPVFDGKSLKQVWNQIEIISIDGSEPNEMISIYL